VRRSDPVGRWDWEFRPEAERAGIPTSQHPLVKLGLVQKETSGYYHPAPQPEVSVVLQQGTQTYGPDVVLATEETEWGYRVYLTTGTSYTWPWDRIFEVREELA
jgi:hypothetical protein